MTKSPSDDFTRLEFAWLDQVAADADLPPLAARMAIILLRYYSRTERAAWPSIETLARDLGAGERSVQRALQTMTPRHLNVIVGGGRSATNKYRWNISPPDTPDKPRQNGQGLSGPETPSEMTPLKPPKPRQNCQGIETETPSILTLNPVKSVQETPSEMTPEPTEENLLKEPTESLSIENEVSKPRKNAPEKRRPSAPKKGKPRASETDFDAWWAIYPKKVSKKSAHAAFDRTIGARKIGLAELMHATTRYAETCDPRFYKNPDGWLNGERWADESQAPARAKVSPLNRQTSVGAMSAVAGILGEDDFQ